MTDKPEIGSVSLCYDSYNYDTKEGYYSFTIGVKNVFSDWEYRETLFNKLQEITTNDVLDWMLAKDFKLPQKDND